MHFMQFMKKLFEVDKYYLAIKPKNKKWKSNLHRLEQLYVPCGFWIWTMAAGWLTVLGWGMVWLYTVLINVYFCTVGAFLCVSGVFCLYGDNILSRYPLFAKTLPGLWSLVFILVWVQCPYLAAVSIELSLSLLSCTMCPAANKISVMAKDWSQGKIPKLGKCNEKSHLITQS